MPRATEKQRPVCLKVCLPVEHVVAAAHVVVEQGRVGVRLAQTLQAQLQGAPKVRLRQRALIIYLSIFLATQAVSLSCLPSCLSM